MSFVRPAAKAALWRYREALVGLCLQILGAWWALQFFGLMTYVGIGVLVLGAILTFLGLQRARFRQSGEGPGVVKLDEGRVLYMGPLSGGTVALADLTRLTYDATSTPAHWVLDHPDGAPVSIPVTATGAETLFDAFAQLPRLKTERMLQVINSKDTHAVVIWENAPLKPAALPLH
jgi:hypothetical protein